MLCLVSFLVFAIILMDKIGVAFAFVVFLRDRIALLLLSSLCIVTVGVLRLFISVLWVGLCDCGIS